LFYNDYNCPEHFVGLAVVNSGATSTLPLKIYGLNLQPTVHYTSE